MSYSSYPSLVERKAKVLSVIKSQKLCVVATSNPKHPSPESALIAHTEDDNLCIYFQTSDFSRKVANLRVNPHLSMVIGTSLDTWITVQYEGKARLLENPEEIAMCKQRFIDKDSPTTAEFFNRPTAIFYKVTPTWIGCTDDTGEKSVVIEITESELAGEQRNSQASSSPRSHVIY